MAPPLPDHLGDAVQVRSEFHAELVGAGDLARTDDRGRHARLRVLLLRVLQKAGEVHIGNGLRLDACLDGGLRTAFSGAGRKENPVIS